jgi:catechol 2,3-dioxygenase-like lactoylglutathione lyase family enzyme
LNEWPSEHCASEPQPFFHRLVCASASVVVFSLALVFLFLVELPAYSAVYEVQSVGLTVSDLDREIRFFTNVLPFEEVSRTEIKDQAANTLFGMQHTVVKLADLKLGSEHIILTQHMSKGRPIPLDSRSYDHWFQHIAIVVRDMDKAYELLRQHRVKFVSTAPQTLPQWNKGAAGIKAFYFRDPENHVLEIIWFPQGKGDPKWQKETDQLFLGIDHTAIVVSDTETSLAFYHDFLGMRVVGESENYGVEQEHLNQVFGARLRITGLRAERGPGIEFLEYLTPPGGRPLPDDSRPNDLVFWRTDLALDHLDDFASSLAKIRTKLVSTGVVNLGQAPLGTARALIVRDPDGHALELVEKPRESASAQR